MEIREPYYCPTAIVHNGGEWEGRDWAVCTYAHLPAIRSIKAAFLPTAPAAAAAAGIDEEEDEDDDCLGFVTTGPPRLAFQS